MASLDQLPGCLRTTRTPACSDVETNVDDPRSKYINNHLRMRYTITTRLDNKNEHVDIYITVHVNIELSGCEKPESIIIQQQKCHLYVIRIQLAT